MKKIIHMLLVILSVFLLVSCGKSEDQQIVKQLELGEKYLSELNYEEAIVAFERVIEIDSKHVESYIKIAEAYAGLNDYENAIEILKQGFEATDSANIQEKMESYRRHIEFIPKVQEIIESLDSDTYTEIWKIMRQEEYQIYVSNLEKVYSYSDDSGKQLLIYPCGHIYYGGFVSGKRNGEAIWVSYDYNLEMADFYRGNWKDDYPDGFGTYFRICIRFPEDLFIEEGNYTDGYENGQFMYTAVYGGEYQESCGYSSDMGIRRKVEDLWPEEAPDREGIYCYGSNEETSLYTSSQNVSGIKHVRKRFDDDKAMIASDYIVGTEEKYEAILQEEREEFED